METAKHSVIKTMVLKIAQLERRTRKNELDQLKRELGYFTTLEISSTNRRQNVFIEGEKLLKARLELKAIKEKRANLDQIKKKLK